MTYRRTLEYLYSQLPMFHRIGAAAYKADLQNTIALCEVLGNPHHNFKSVHVAGTNGKGSVSHMMASVLQTAGYKTGLFTSPHLKDFRERIRINGRKIPQREVTDFVKRWEQALHHIQPSFFEWTAGLAFDYFSRQKVDIAVIETGMGGRLDSTNVIHPLLSVITNIGYDHTAFLGSTLEEIATEKAGIIKHGLPVVIGETQSETKTVFDLKAKQMQAPLVFADQTIHAEQVQEFNPDDGAAVYDIYHNEEILIKNLICPLAGNYQQKNIVTVLAVLIELSKHTSFPIKNEHISIGISNVVKQTGLLGRWQVLHKQPLTICDVAHNREGLSEVLPQLLKLSHRRLHIVLGMVNDKDYVAVLKLFPPDADYYFCQPAIPRGLDAHILANAAYGLGLKGNTFDSVRDAYVEAQKHAQPKDVIFIGGSTFVVAEVL